MTGAEILSAIIDACQARYLDLRQERTSDTYSILMSKKEANAWEKRTKSREKRIRALAAAHSILSEAQKAARLKQGEATLRIQLLDANGDEFYQQNIKRRKDR